MMTYIGAYLCTTDASRNIENGRIKRDERNRNHHGASLDSPTDVVLGKWLLVEDTQPSPSDSNSGLLIRRITPKSVFVAPSFSGCSEGYRLDGMGRCVKLVKVNQAAQLDFLLQKLNSMYASPSSNHNNKNKNDNKENSGPFHVSLPLGGLDNSSNNKNNNNNVPNNKQTNTTKPTHEETSPSLASPSISSSNSNNNNKKTEFLHNTNLPTATPQSSHITTTEPQLNTSDSTTDKSNIETTTNIFNVNVDIIPTTLRSPVDPPEESQPHIFYQSNFDSTVKREPQNSNNFSNNNNNKEIEDLNNTKKPFVIVVANSTSRPPFDPSGEDNLNASTDETISFLGYDSSTITTSKGIQTTTENALLDTTTSNNYSDTMETITTNDGFTTILSTTTMRTTFSNDEQSSLYTTTETTPFEPSKLETISEDLTSSTYLNTHTTTTMIPYPSSIDEKENEETDQQEEEEEEEIGSIDEEVEDNDGDEDDKIDINKEFPVFGDVIHSNKNTREPSRIPITRIPGTSAPVNLNESMKKRCNFPLHVTGSNYGKVNYGTVDTDCEPEATTVRYQVRTTTPKPSSYYIRFPVDTSTNNGYKKTNGYIRFPEQSSSSAYTPSSYGIKTWNTDSTSASSSMWYPPSWFPFLQPHRSWQQDSANPHGNQPSHQPLSTVYHKQYHQQHHLPQSVPTWINTHPTWSQRD